MPYPLRRIIMKDEHQSEKKKIKEEGEEVGLTRLGETEVLSGDDAFVGYGSLGGHRLQSFITLSGLSGLGRSRSHVSASTRGTEAESKDREIGGSEG